MKKAFVLGSVMALVMGTVAFACDGWRQIESKNERYENVELTAQQRQQIDDMKKQAVAQFRDDHKEGGCDERHEQTLTRFVTEADGVLTNVQRMELRTGERIKELEEEIAQLRREIRELKDMIREISRKR